MEGRFTVAPGVVNVLGMANTKTSGYDFLFSGCDLSQMARQRALLIHHNFDVGNWDVYPAVRTKEDYRRGLRLFFDLRVAGWWNYRQAYAREGVCTPVELEKAFGQFLSPEGKARMRQKRRLEKARKRIALSQT